MQSSLKSGRQWRVAVVGAGPGGLASAIMLAQAGAKVTLYERQSSVGGRTRTIQTEGGYRFDIGPTFFLYPRVLSEIFASCGERLEDWVRLERLDPQYDLVFEGQGGTICGTIRATPDVPRMQAEIARLAPRDAENVGRFLADNRAKLKAFRPVLEQSFDRLRDMVSPAMLKALPTLRPASSVDRDLRRYFADPRVRLAFSFQTKYLGMSPFRCPSLFTILSFLEYEHGVFHPVGGCGAVSDAMAGLAARMGVTILLGTAVDRVVFEGRRAAGVEVGGQVLDADAVIINGDFAKVVPALVPQARRPRWRDRKIARARLSCSTFMLYLGIEGEVAATLAHHTILLAKDHTRNMREIADGIMPLEPSVYVQHAGYTDGGMAPPGHTSLYVLVPVPNLRDGAHPRIDWQTAAPGFRRLVLDRLKLLGLGDIEPRIRYERMTTPMDWRDEFAVHEGATFNLSHDLGQMLHLRPHNRFGPGLYLVGGGTHPGSGLPVIYESARITARLVEQDAARARGGALAQPMLVDTPDAIGAGSSGVSI